MRIVSLVIPRSLTRQQTADKQLKREISVTAKRGTRSKSDEYGVIVGYLYALSTLNLLQNIIASASLA